MLGRNRLSRRALSGAAEDVDPMGSLGNLADAMLVMAVGLMVALIAAWQLNMDDIRVSIELAEQSQDIDITTDEEAPTIEDFGLSEYGRVYVDEDGTYYMVENPPEGTEGEGEAGNGAAAASVGE